MAWGTGLAATAHRGYWPGCYSPQDGQGVQALLHQPPGCSGGTGLAATGPRLLQPTGGTGMAATAPRIAWGYWPGCFRPQVGLGVLAWLLQAPGWSGVLAWLL